MRLPLTVSCFSKIQIGFTFLVPAHPGSPGKRAVKRVCVCVCVCYGVGAQVWANSEMSRLLDFWGPKIQQPNFVLQWYAGISRTTLSNIWLVTSNSTTSLQLQIKSKMQHLAILNRHLMPYTIWFVGQEIAFSALTLLVGRQEGHPACKKLSGGVLARLSVWSEGQTCIWTSWCYFHSQSLASVKSRLVLPFWYRLTRT